MGFDWGHQDEAKIFCESPWHVEESDFSHGNLGGKQNPATMLKPCDSQGER